MLPYVFSHGDDVYVLSFRQIDEFWVAGLYRRGDAAAQVLTRFVEAKIGGLSDEAIRAGYIAVAKWIASVKTAESDTLEAAPLDGAPDDCSLASSERACAADRAAA